MEHADLGSIVVTNSTKRTYYINNEFVERVIVKFEGLSEDFSKLEAASLTDPFDKMSTGSTCLLYDTTQVYKYNADDKTWYEL